MGEWQPIETAPKDGSAIWVLVDGHPFIGYCEPARPPLYENPTWFIKVSFRRRLPDDTASSDDIFGCYAFGVAPTAWMPLPDPPKE